MPVDSFKFLPRVIAYYYQQTDREPLLPIPWTPLKKPIQNSKFGLVTSGGIFHRGKDEPFNLEREKKEQVWGDPSYRKIPVTIKQHEVGVSHLHINTEDILQDINVLLPVDRFKSLVADGTIADLAEFAYSFMGFQGFPPDTTLWETEFGPEVAESLISEGIDCVLLTPA